MSYTTGVQLTVTDVDGNVIDTQDLPAGMRGQPAYFSVEIPEAGVYTLTVAWLPPAVGTYENPDVLEIDTNTVDIEAGSQGYYFTWTAHADGELTITVVSDDGNWTYAISNLTTNQHSDTQWSDEDTAVNTTAIEVYEGNVIRIIVNTYDPTSPWEAPAGTITVTASFTPAE